MIYLIGDFSNCIDGMKDPKGKYNLYTNNCAQMSMKLLQSADSKYKYIFEKASEIILPSQSYEYVREAVVTRDFLDRRIPRIPRVPISFPVKGGGVHA